MKLLEMGDIKMFIGLESVYAMTVEIDRNNRYCDYYDSQIVLIINGNTKYILESSTIDNAALRTFDQQERYSRDTLNKYFIGVNRESWLIEEIERQKNKWFPNAKKIAQYEKDLQNIYDSKELLNKEIELYRSKADKERERLLRLETEFEETRLKYWFNEISLLIKGEL